MKAVFISEKNAYAIVSDNPYLDQYQMGLIATKDNPTPFIPNTPTGHNILKCLHERGMFNYSPLPTDILDTNHPSLPDDIDFGQYLPHSHQTQPIADMIHYNHYMLAMSMGTGKTYCVIQTFKYLAKKTDNAVFLVICPRTVISTWEQQIQKYAPELRVFTAGDEFGVQMRATIIASAMLVPNAVIITSYDTFNVTKYEITDKVTEDVTGGFHVLFNMNKRFEAVVLDESTKIKNTEAKRTKGIMKIARLGKRRYVMTGFPSPQAPSDYIGQCAFLHPWYLGYTRTGAFINTAAIKDNFTQQIVDWVPSQIDLLKNELKHFAVHLDIADTQIKLPPIIYKTIQVKMGQQQAEIYKRVEDEYVAWLDQNNAMITDLKACASCEGGEVIEIIDGNYETHLCEECEGTGIEGAGKGNQFAIVAKTALVKFQKLGQITGGWGSVKVPCKYCQGAKERNGKLCRYCDEEGMGTNHIPLKDNPKLDTLIQICVNDEGQGQIEKPYVVFSYYRHELAAISAKLGIPIIWGGTTKKELDEYIRQLQNGEIEGIAIQPDAGGMGIDGLQCARTAIYYTNSFKLESRIQSEKRLHRIGQTGSVLVIDLQCPKTADEYVIDKLQEKKEIGLEILKFKELRKR